MPSRARLRAWKVRHVRNAPGKFILSLQNADMSKLLYCSSDFLFVSSTWQNADDIRAAHPVSPPSTSQAPINPMISDPVTMAATQSIQSELNLLAGESGLMSPPGAGSSGRQRLLSSSSLLAGEQFITGASPPPSTDHLASQGIQNESSNGLARLWYKWQFVDKLCTICPSFCLVFV